MISEYSPEVQQLRAHILEKLNRERANLPMLFWRACNDGEHDALQLAYNLKTGRFRVIPDLSFGKNEVWLASITWLNLYKYTKLHRLELKHFKGYINNPEDWENFCDDVSQFIHDEDFLEKVNRLKDK